MAETSRKRAGFTLAEVAIAVLLFGLTVGGLYTAFLMGRVATYRARYQSQVINLLQAKVEQLWVGSYDAVLDEGPTNLTIDPGSDLEWGTADDLVGTLRVEVDDRMDLDNDGDTDEEEIDLDDDGVNDAIKPVHVSLTWQSFSFGGTRSQTVSLDTLIAER
jgi:hypothetical protein